MASELGHVRTDPSPAAAHWASAFSYYTQGADWRANAGVGPPNAERRRCEKLSLVNVAVGEVRSGSRTSAAPNQLQMTGNAFTSLPAACLYYVDSHLP